jgi:hypothetical protein
LPLLGDGLAEGFKVSVLTRNRKWPAFLSVFVAGAAVGGVLGVLPVTEASAIATPGVTVAGGNGLGSGANQLGEPGEVFVDSFGNVYVADQGNNRVQIWTPGATSGVTVAGGNGQGSAADQLSLPQGVFVNKSGDVYVADTFNNRVQEWAPGATSGVTVAGGNGAGPAANQLNSPWGLFVDGDDNVYVADTFNDRVQKWAPGATSGVTVAGGNGEGSAANQLWFPIGTSLDGSGNVYVAELFNSRVQKWAPGATSGVTVAGGNGPGEAANQLYFPYGVSVDGSGNVYAADSGLYGPNNIRVQEWTPRATAGVTVAGGNGVGSAANQLSFASDVFVDGSGNIYVSDQLNNRVQKFAPPSPPTTSVLLPSKGATVSGGTWLDAAASSPIGVTSVTFEVSAGRSGSEKVIGSATSTLWGWLAGWDTTKVHNGTYTLRSVATDALGHSTTSAGVTVKVENNQS